MAEVNPLPFTREALGKYTSSGPAEPAHLPLKGKERGTADLEGEGREDAVYPKAPL